MNKQSPSLETIKMQVYFDMNYTTQGNEIIIITIFRSKSREKLSAQFNILSNIWNNGPLQSDETFFLKLYTIDVILMVV